jgi:hypothetical protein
MPTELPAEWVLRQLQTVDLDDPLWLMTVLDMRGMCWSTAERLRNPEETPEELGAALRPRRDDLHARVHLTDAQALLTALRDAGGQWLTHIDTGRPLQGSFWWLLHAGTNQFSHIVVDRADHLEGDLFEAGCWQLYCITRGHAPVKRCSNERCGRLFYRQTPDQRFDTRVKYCSTQCREAQKKRTQRHRRLTVRQ